MSDVTKSENDLLVAYAAADRQAQLIYQKTISESRDQLNRTRDSASAAYLEVVRSTAAVYNLAGDPAEQARAQAEMEAHNASRLQLINDLSSLAARPVRDALQLALETAKETESATIEEAASVREAACRRALQTRDAVIARAKQTYSSEAQRAENALADARISRLAIWNHYLATREECIARLQVLASNAAGGAES